MKDKAKFLIKQSLKKKMDTKWFKVVNIILLILLVGVMNIDKIISYFGGDFEEARKIYVVSSTEAYQGFEDNFKAMATSVKDMSKYEMELSSEDVDSLKDGLDDKGNLVVEIVPDKEEYLVANIYSYDAIDTITEQILVSSLNALKSSYALQNSGIDQAELTRVMAPMSVKTEMTNPDSEDSEAKDIMSGSVLIIFLIPFFMLIILLVQMIGAEINDEKTTRGMEIIISNVSPKVHFFSKIIASTGFVIMQALLIFIYGAIGFGVRIVTKGGISVGQTGNIGTEISKVFDILKNSGMLDSIVKALPIILLIFIFSFLAYALLAGILASMTTSIEDYQQLQTPLMLLLMAGYYIGIMASMFKGSIFIKVVSFIPFISALVAPITYALGQTTIIDLGISCGLLVLVCYLLFKYGIRVYKVGILNYSSKDLWKKVFKSLKQKEV